MKQDLKELFKDDTFPKKKLPENHEEDFIKKLKAQNLTRKKTPTKVLKIAASIAILLTIGYFVVSSLEGKDQTTPLQKQVAEIEKTYLKQIDQEWQAFVSVAKDPNLVAYYKDRLDRSKEDYEEISERFSKEPNSIVIIEELIENLKGRLDLLKRIKNHVEQINKKKKSYETIFI